MEATFRIGEVAAAARVAPSKLRYYERIGLLPEAERVSGQRRYDGSVLERLSLIDVGQRAGLSLDEMRDLLDAGSEPISANLRELATRKLPAVEGLIARAEAMRGWLQRAQACDCETVHECGLFDSALLPDALKREERSRVGDAGRAVSP
jgi:MerR family transcriptional regulator, redox-sensitive transcriptional activator SoxR